MKKQLKAMGTRDLKPVFAFMKEQWGIDKTFPWAWYLSTKDDLYIVSKDITKIDAQKLRINSVGLYFGEFRKGHVRVSIDGSQLIGPHAKKNVVELDKAERREWLRGTDLDKVTEADGFVIIKSGSDFIGSGKVKEGRILNFVPKGRRLLVD